MTGHKCLQCGLINFADSSHCKRCRAEITLTPEPEPEPSDLPPAQPTASILVYLLAIGLGKAIFLVIFLFSFRRSPNSSLVSFLILGITYAALGAWLASRRRLRAWLLALCISSVYLISTGFTLFRVIRSNELYGGWFWSDRFYFSPIVIYAAVPLAAFLGTRFGVHRTLFRLVPLLCLFVATFISMGYARGGPRPARELTYSGDITAESPIQLTMRLNVKLSVQVSDEPMNFRTVPTAREVKDGGWKVTVLRKDSNFAPTTQMTINIDGKKLHNTMWPVNGPDGSSHVSFSKEQNYADIVEWRVGHDPEFFGSLSGANQVELTWGNAQLVLPPEQVESLRSFARNWYQILREEKLLCTNPMCVQGALNPRR